MQYVVHTSGEGLNRREKAYVIKAPSKEKAKEIAKEQFSEDFLVIDGDIDIRPYRRTCRAIMAYIFMLIPIGLSFVNWKVDQDVYKRQLYVDAEPPEGNGGTCEYGGDKDASVFTGSLGIGSPFSDGGRICLLFWQSGGRRDAEIIFFIPYARIQIDDFFGSKGCGAAFGNRRDCGGDCSIFIDPADFPF